MFKFIFILIKVLFAYIEEIVLPKKLLHTHYRKNIVNILFCINAKKICNKIQFYFENPKNSFTPTLFLSQTKSGKSASIIIYIRVKNMKIGAY